MEPRAAERSIYRTFKLGVFIVLLFGARNVVSQKLLFQKNQYRQVYYQTGDIITFNVKGNRDRIRAQITGFRDSVIVFRNFTLTPDEISHLYVDDKTKQWYILRYKYEKLFLIAGVGYLALDVVNTGEINPQTLKISGVLVGAGLLAKFFISKKIKIKGRRRLVIIG